MVGAVILAAGAGRRMGGTPKAILDLDGRTFLEHVTVSLREADCGPLWAVTRPGVPELGRLCVSLGLRAIPNPDPERGMFSSVVLGVETARREAPDLAGLVIFPVDHPRVRSDTVARLVGALHGKPAAICIQPSHEGQGGHPLAMDAAAAGELLGLDPSLTLREALRRTRPSRVVVPVDDPGVLVNINTPGER